MAAGHLGHLHFILCCWAWNGGQVQQCAAAHAHCARPVGDGSDRQPGRQLRPGRLQRLPPPLQPSADETPAASGRVLHVALSSNSRPSIKLSILSSLTKIYFKFLGGRLQTFRHMFGGLLSSSGDKYSARTWLPDTKGMDSDGGGRKRRVRPCRACSAVAVPMVDCLPRVSPSSVHPSVMTAPAQPSLWCCVSIPPWSLPRTSCMR